MPIPTPASGGAAGSLLPDALVPETSGAPELTVEQLEAVRAAVVEEVKSWGAVVSPNGTVTAGTSRRAAVSPGTLDHVETVLERIDAQIGLLRQLANEVGVDGGDHPPPPPLDPNALMVFETLDAILDQRDSVRQAVRLAEEDEADIGRSLEEAETLERSRQQDRRRLEEAARQARGTAKSAEAEREALEARWRARAAAEELRLEELRIRSARATAEAGREALADLEARAAEVRERLQVSRDDLEKAIEALRQEVEPQRDRLAEIERELDEAHEKWIAARASRADSREEQAAREAEMAYHRTVLDLLENERQVRVGRLEVLAAVEQISSLRYAAAGVDAGVEGDRAERTGRLESHVRELERRERAAERRLEELRAQQRVAESRASRPMAEVRTDGPAAAESARAMTTASGSWTEREIEALDQGLALSRAHLERVRSSLSLARRALEETDVEQVQLLEAVGRAGRSLAQVWGWELTSVDDRPITFGKVIVALLLILLGYRVSKRLSQTLSRLLMQRFSVSSGAAHALQNLAFYLLVVVFFLWGFQLVGIPLTVFTLLGGVVAIGVGFGSQNVVNNFISGLILLIERPIKVADLIDVDGVLGTVERIGLRSTRVRAGNNTHIFVPNSSFLEKNVLNWTGSDDLVRSYVDVGVAYGSPVEKVRELIESTLIDEPLVLATPESEVLFMDFGDNALLFRAYFWHRARQGLDPARAQSALRFRMDAVLAEAGIVIAFPQRDVHLDSLSPLRLEPLRVELLERSRRPSEAGEGEAGRKEDRE